MKIFYLFYLVMTLVCGFTCTKESCTVDDDFLGDLASEDKHIAGRLYRTVFNGSLDSLKYDYYIAYLSTHEAPSAKGLGDRIKCADRKYFKTSKEAFLILLYYGNSEMVVGDNSGTSFVDTVIQGQKEIPNLEEIAGKMRF
jgi:hypothetical protein